MFILKIQQHVSRYGLLQLFSHCWIPDILSFYTVLKHRVCIRHIVLHSLINTTVTKFCAANYREHKILKHSIKQHGFWDFFYVLRKTILPVYTQHYKKKLFIHSASFSVHIPQVHLNLMAASVPSIESTRVSPYIITLCIKWHSCSKWG